MKEKETSVDDVFRAIKKGKTAAEKDFTKWLADLPTSIERDELSAFSEERRAAMYKSIASDKGVTADDFAGIFKQECISMKPQALTDKFEVEGSETLCKVEANQAITIFGSQKEDEKGLLRSECTV